MSSKSITRLKWTVTDLALQLEKHKALGKQLADDRAKEEQQLATKAPKKARAKARRADRKANSSNNPLAEQATQEKTMATWHFSEVAHLDSTQCHKCHIPSFGTVINPSTACKSGKTSKHLWMVGRVPLQMIQNLSLRDC